ncbi:NEDD8 activating enzyme [Malassezia pachydermatis]
MRFCVIPMRMAIWRHTTLRRTCHQVVLTFSLRSQAFLQNECRVLIVGAGGLGCEILVNMALMGFRDLHIIDMDTIDVSNLNRQFLFREKDIGQPKATTAASFVMQRAAGVKITPHVCRIQAKELDFYKQFHMILCGLDSVEARRWMNATLVHMVDEADPRSLIPLIDGGTEGLRGQARVILPTITSCYECSLDMLPKRQTYPICTIANTPRLPEHCIEWASILEWPRTRPGEKLDKDDPQHIQWVMEHAIERAKQHGITGITWSLTQGVVKNIIPAIASTNAIIAAACTQEAFKIATSTAPYLNNYMMYAGNDGMYTYTFEYAKRVDCPVCGGESRTITLASTDTLAHLVDLLRDLPDIQCKRPTISSEKGPLYYAAPPALEEATRPNLDKTLAELHLRADDVVSVADPAWPFVLSVVLDLLTPPH